VPSSDADIETLIARRAPAVRALTLELVRLVQVMRPDFRARVAFGWNTVNFHHASGFICAVYPATDHVSLIFQDGKQLDSPLLKDDGKVKRVRWIPLRPGARLPVDDIGILLAEAVALRS
jgi:hypothetical protein